MKYVPFLKLKQNEIRAIGDLDKEVNEDIIPFFDITQIEDLGDKVLKENLISRKKDIEKNFKNSQLLYIDNYDHQDSSNCNYELVLETYKNLNIIPVIGIDRDDEHIDSVIDYLGTKDSNKKLAIRFNVSDIQSFNIIKDDIEDYLIPCIKLCNDLHIIIDLRIIDENNINYLENRVTKFIYEIEKYLLCNKIIITSSIFPPIIGKIIKTNQIATIDRLEHKIWGNIKKNLFNNNNLIFGDYTNVSPDYAEPTISMSIIQNVMTPKVSYTEENTYYLIRGKAFKSSKYGFDQYFFIAQNVIKKSFFRGEKYSLGDKYIYDRGIVPRSEKIKKGGNPSSWIRNTICSHITFIRDII